MTTKTGRKKLNFLNRVDEVTDPFYYGHLSIYGPRSANLKDVLWAVEDLVALRGEAQQEKWDDMTGIVDRKLSSLADTVRYLERAAEVKI